MTEELATTIERLAAAAAALEHLASRLTENEEATIGRIVAQVEQRSDSILEQRLAAAEQQIAQRDQRIAELEAAAIEAAAPASRNDAGSRKTVPTAMANLLGKHGIALDGLEAGSLDAALTGLSMEQRFAVKAQLLRAGLVA